MCGSRAQHLHIFYSEIRAQVRNGQMIYFACKQVHAKMSVSPENFAVIFLLFAYESKCMSATFAYFFNALLIQAGRGFGKHR